MEKIKRLRKPKKQYIARLHPDSLAVIEVLELLGSQRDNNNHLILVAKSI